MGECINSNGTTLFGFVTIGQHVVFYQKVLSCGKLERTQTEPFHWWNSAGSIQQYFDYFKVNIPICPIFVSISTTLAMASSSISSYANPNMSSSTGGVASYTVANLVNYAMTSSSTSGVARASPATLALDRSSPYVNISIPVPDFYVKNGQYFSGDGNPLLECPKNVWVYNERGWSDTGREKKWRYWDGKKVSYQ